MVFYKATCHFSKNKDINIVVLGEDNARLVKDAVQSILLCLKQLSLLNGESEVAEDYNVAVEFRNDGREYLIPLESRIPEEISRYILSKSLKPRNQRSTVESLPVSNVSLNGSETSLVCVNHSEAKGNKKKISFLRKKKERTDSKSLLDSSCLSTGPTGETPIKDLNSEVLMKKEPEESHKEENNVKKSFLSESSLSSEEEVKKEKKCSSSDDSTSSDSDDSDDSDGNVNSLVSNNSMSSFSSLIKNASTHGVPIVSTGSSKSSEPKKVMKGPARSFKIVYKDGEKEEDVVTPTPKLPEATDESKVYRRKGRAKK